MTPTPGDAPAPDATGDGPYADLGHDPAPGVLGHAPHPAQDAPDAPSGPAQAGADVTPEPLAGRIYEPDGPRDLTHELARFIDQWQATAPPDAGIPAFAAAMVEWLSDKGQTLGSDDPAVWGMKVYRNILERRTAEQALSDLQTEFGEALDVVREQIAAIDQLRGERADLDREVQRLRARVDAVSALNIDVQAERDRAVRAAERLKREMDGAREAAVQAIEDGIAALNIEGLGAYDAERIARVDPE